MSRKIVINADDFGLCRGVNEAVVRAHTDGVLTSATIMANMPGSQDAVELAGSLPSLGVGVHLNLTGGRPLTGDGGANFTGSDGKFALGPARLSAMSLLSSRLRIAIRTELDAQIKWLIDRGLRPTHLDSHKHIHCFPVIFGIVAGLADKYGISAIRWPVERQRFSADRWPRPDKRGVITSKTVSVMAKINRLQNSKYFRTDEVLGIAHTGRIDVAFFCAVCLHNSARTAEIMTHPGLAEGLDSSETRLVEQRQAELEALCSRETRLHFERAGVQLVHYGQL